jgi:hypothetical protein
VLSLLLNCMLDKTHTSPRTACLTTTSGAACVKDQLAAAALHVICRDSFNTCCCCACCCGHTASLRAARIVCLLCGCLNDVWICCLTVDRAVPWHCVCPARTRDSSPNDLVLHRNMPQVATTLDTCSTLVSVCVDRLSTVASSGKADRATTIHKVTSLRSGDGAVCGDSSAN